MEKCKHGMNPAFCAPCRSQDSKVSGGSVNREGGSGNLDQQLHRLREERKRAEFVVHEDARAALETGYVRIFTGGGRNHHSFNDLDVHTRVVHINGHPFLWAIQKILERAPNVSVIELIPSMFARVQRGQVKTLCEQRAVRLVAGHDRPDTAWAGKENRSPIYDKQRAFFVGLQREQKRSWEELLAMKFEAAELTARYFCLNGEEYRSQPELGEDYGIPKNQYSMVSMRINAVLYYLDSFFETGDRSKQFSGMMRRRVERLRPVWESAAKRQQVADELGIPHLPEKLPLAYLELYRALIGAVRDGRINRLAEQQENAHCALALRYGLYKLARI